MSDNRKSLVDEIKEDRYRSPGYYAAGLAMNVQILMNRALESRPDMSLADIAEIVGVDEERVRWAFSLNDVDHIPAGMAYRDWNSDGNLHTASIAKFLKALGYKLELKVKAVEEDTDAEYVNHRAHRGDGVPHRRRYDGVSKLAVLEDSGSEETAS